MNSQNITLSPQMDDMDKFILCQIMDGWVNEAFYTGDSINEKKLRAGILRLYKENMLDEPEIIICDNPAACQTVLQDMIYRKIHSPSLLPSSLWLRVDVRMWQNKAWSGIWCEALSRVNPHVNPPHLSFLKSYIIAKVKSAANSQSSRYFNFSEDNLFFRYARVSFYEFISRISGVMERELEDYISFLKSGCFLSLFFSEVAIICRRPKSIRFNSNNQFHCDGGPALEWRSGWKDFYLNGVCVPEHVAITPAEELDPEMVLREKNTGVRREIVRKIGADRLVKKLMGKVIDSWNGYELLQLEVPGMMTKPTYLKMKNPSIGTCHIEGVPSRISTCKDALSWRVGGLKWNPKQLT